MKALFRCSLFLAAALMAQAVMGQALLRPFVLADRISGQAPAALLTQIKSRLGEAGFSEVCDYTPYESVRIICVTSPALQSAAAASERGGYAAVLRVALTEVDGQIEVSFNNPVYLAQAYRLKTDLAEVRQALQSALGYKEDFGAEGRSADELRDYNYAFLMEKFHHPWKLGSFDSHAAAVAAVEQGLAKAAEGVRRVYRLDIPGSDQVLFGVAFDGGPMGNNYMNDAFIMKVIDARSPRSSAHLPYEILVDGRRVESLHARFRIAINFPDLKMVGEHSFMDIMNTPPSLENAMRRTLGVDPGS